jgi:hypothetical protein
VDQDAQWVYPKGGSDQFVAVGAGTRWPVETRQTWLVAERLVAGPTDIERLGPGVVCRSRQASLNRDAIAIAVEPDENYFGGRA